jgi:DNA-3-methyladenine glycosylase I
MAQKITENLERCGWGESPPDYTHYHDTEWGRPVTDDRVLFEKLCLEGFQSGLSWLTVLRKRPAFREVFDNFDAASVAKYSAADVDRLLGDARIIRHRGKIEATINNAQALMRLYEEDGRTLAEVMWSHQPANHPVPEALADVPATTPESKALAKELKSLGFKFVGPTTAYAALQAMGVVNDHLSSCFCRRECEVAQQEATSSIKGLKPRA